MTPALFGDKADDHREGMNHSPTKLACRQLESVASGPRSLNVTS